MRSPLQIFIGAILGACAVGYVVDDAIAWQRAATVVDSGFRRLGFEGSNDRPGAIFLEPDSYYWLSYARRIGNGESWRVRYTHADNAPYGRPVHWSQSISWLLVAFGKVEQTVTGEAWVTALEKASVWVNPVLLILLISAVGWNLFRRVGPIPAALFMSYLVTLGDIGWEFQPLRPDHQSLQALFGIFMLVGLAFGGAGWISTDVGAGGSLSETTGMVSSLRIPAFRSARHWFVVSGLSVAFNLWVSAVVAVSFLMILFAAALLLIWRAPRLEKDGNIQAKPELWRWWGWTASAGAMLFYLIEYFPNHLSLFRLEVNGPLYCLAAAAIGEALCQFMRARYAPSGHALNPLIKGMISSGVVALLPLAIICGPESWHALKDAQMYRLHNFIQEFYSFPRFAGSRTGMLHLFFRNMGILPFALLIGAWLVINPALRIQERAALWLSFAVTLGILMLSYLQVRWLGLYAAANAWFAVVVGVCAWRLVSDRLPGRVRTVTSIIIVVLLLIQPVLFAERRSHQILNIIKQRAVPKDLTNPVLNKRLALAFRKAEGPGARVMASLDLAPQLHYFGEAASVAAYYWEDVDGLHAATKFFADTEGNEAKEVARSRGLTHVIVQEGNSLENYFYFIATGKLDRTAANSLFAAHLVGNEFTLPPWLEMTPDLQSIGFQLYTYGNLKFEERWRIYRIKLE